MTPPLSPETDPQTPPPPPPTPERGGEPPVARARVPSFVELSPPREGAEAGSLDRLLDVVVTVTAELGRTTMSIEDVLKVGAGSVVELDRAIGEPVDLMVQGVCVARGEVVVVDDRFAVRIKEIIAPRRRG